MKRMFIVSMVPMLLLPGCGTAEAFHFDPSNDVHCTGVANFMHSKSLKQPTPEDQRFVAFATQRWYAQKKIEQIRRLGEAEYTRQVEQVFQAALQQQKSGDNEPSAMAAATCADRVALDPAFSKFVAEAEAEFRRGQ